MNADGSAQRRLWHDDQGEGVASPSWSPDGEKLDFTVGYDAIHPDVEIRVIDASGATCRVIPASDPGAGAVGIGSVAWSPDGTRIAYVVDGAQFGAYDLESPSATAFWSSANCRPYSFIGEVSWFAQAQRRFGARLD